MPGSSGLIPVAGYRMAVLEKGGAGRTGDGVRGRVGVWKVEVGPCVVLLVAELCRGFRCGRRKKRIGSTLEEEAEGKARGAESRAHRAWLLAQIKCFVLSAF
jgi:hypothetical protein